MHYNKDISLCLNNYFILPLIHGKSLNETLEAIEVLENYSHRYFNSKNKVIYNREEMSELLKAKYFQNR